MNSPERTQRFSFASWGGRDLWAVVGLALLFVLAMGRLAPVGFTGTDDYHYIQGVQRWLSEGPHAGANHWQNRLPYVLTIAGFFRLFGPSLLTLEIFHGLLFVGLILVTWLLAKSTFDRRNVAWFSVGVVMAMPLLNRYISFFYPELLEIVLLGVTCFLVLHRLHWGAYRWPVLFFAGLVGGVALLVRETAIAVPAALALLMLVQSPKQSLKERVLDVAFLALGFVIPPLIEMGFYHAMTGDALYRFKVDQAHVKLASRLKDKASIDTNHVLFNWNLAQHWERDSLVDAPWMLKPVVRLLISPGMLFIPITGFVGLVLALKQKGARRELALLAFAILLLQYLLNTFVLVLPPNTRYFGMGLIFLAIGAAYLLVRMFALRWALIVFAIMFAAPAMGAALLQSSMARSTNALVALVRDADQPVYLPPAVAKYTVLRRLSDPSFAAKTRIGQPEVGDLIAQSGFGRAESLTSPCKASGDRVQLVATSVSPTLVYRWASDLGIARYFPSKLSRLLRHEADRASIYRRLC